MADPWIVNVPDRRLEVYRDPVAEIVVAECFPDPSTLQ